MSSNWQWSTGFMRIYDKPQYWKYHDVPVDGETIKKNYYNKYTWCNNGRYQGRFKYTAAFIDYCEFDKKRLETIGFGPQYVWGDVNAKTMEELQEEMDKYEERIIWDIHRMIVKKDKREDKKTYLRRLKKIYKIEEVYKLSNDKGSENKEEEADDEDQDTCAWYMDDHGRRRSSRILNMDKEEE